ncbi:hypothetical protein [Streptomyces sp. NPDC094032]|uniref:hypothetical protein n=1 Tax=Streptomyces sp. NPDC094032 TaxID=3155308 RepID=UPI00331E6513
MTDHATTAVTTLLATTEQQGPGNTLRIVLLVSIVGGALLAWFLLRGYGGADDNDTGAGNDDGAANVKIAENAVKENRAGDANA